MIIAIDGPSASGKGTLAARLAKHFGMPHLDTGLLYRAVGKLARDEGVDPDDPQATSDIAETLDLAVLDDAGLRGDEAGEAASRVAVHRKVRKALLDLQRRFAHQPGGAVLDGRDIGTVIAPGAEVKIFVTAAPEIRARRRYEELQRRGIDVTFDQVLDDLRRRDARDTSRPDAPLKPAPDALILDTTALDAEGALMAALAMIERRRA